MASIPGPSWRLIGDVALGCTSAAGIDAVHLLMLTNGFTLRGLSADERAPGFGTVQSNPARAFSPVAVTPDELGGAWQDGRVHLSVEVLWNGQSLGCCDAGGAMKFHFGELVAHLSRTRGLRAGSIVGSGTISNPDPTHGQTCIAEKRSLEMMDGGQTGSEFMQFGDTVRIDMKGHDGSSVFGAIGTAAARSAPAMRAELPRSTKVVTVSLLLGLVLFLAVQWWQRSSREMRFSAQGETIEIRRSNDGHYHWPGSINGRELDFLIDTGATPRHPCTTGSRAGPSVHREHAVKYGRGRGDRSGGVGRRGARREASRRRHCA